MSADSDKTMESLKREFLELLDRDVEFRYAVAGHIGLSEILKRLDSITEEQLRLREEQTKIWREIAGLHKEIANLREDMITGFRRHDEEFTKIWTEIARIHEEIAKLREDMTTGFRRHDEEFTKIWEEVRALRISQDRLWRYVRGGFKDLRRAIGMAFDDYARSFIEFHLDEIGYHEANVERKLLIHEGKLLEINIFCEEPLIIGEATLTIRDIVEAEREIEKILERVRVVEGIFKKKPLLTVLAVSHTPPDIVEILENLTEKYNIRLILGKEIEEHL